MSHARREISTTFRNIASARIDNSTGCAEDRERAMVPFRRKNDELVRPIANAVGSARHTGELDFLGMPAIVASRAMQQVIEKAQKVGRTDSTVLIQGESGVGKELVARAVHHYSQRRDRPFVDVNCAAFPEHLIESELFGYEKGAFSGADGIKQGLFEAAAGGTLFLDEIGELETHVQSKLLRVLDGQSYYRLGGTRKIQITTRIIAATNANLVQAVQKGWFRADLYHRLDAIQLRVPSLRERVDDILPLCDLFLRTSGCHLRGDAAEMLRNYNWPGNIRELRNVLNKAVVFANGTELTPADLPVGVRCDATPEPGYSLERLEEETIRRALEQTGGHQQKAADILGISRRTLIRKLKTYGLLRGHDRTEASDRKAALAARVADHNHMGSHGSFRKGPGFSL
jgi:two-component system response regulator AtoC